MSLDSSWEVTARGNMNRRYLQQQASLIVRQNLHSFFTVLILAPKTS